MGGYGAAALCVVYGSMKLAQALGANALADKDPLPPELHERLVARDLAWWDLLLWSPLFLLWGTCWTTAAVRLRRVR